MRAWTMKLKVAITALVGRPTTFTVKPIRVGLVLIALLGPSSVVASPVDMFVFGDSLSDTGNMFGLSAGGIPPDPPYASGRFSNGAIWVEQLADMLGLGSPNNAYVSGMLAGGINNFAVGGAHTGPRPFDFGLPIPPFPPDPLPSRNSNDDVVGVPVFPGLLGPPFPGFPAIPSEIDLFSLLSGGVASPDAWYVVWGGANDLIFAPDFSPAMTASDVAPSAVANIRTAIETLASMGAQEYLVLNLPDLAATPFGVLSGRSAELTAGTDLFNTELESMIADVLVLSPGIEIMLLDINTILGDLLDAVIADPVGAGFPDASALPFVPGGLSFCINQNTLPVITDFCAAFGLDPNGVVFWDLLHPTEHTHSLIAQAVFDAKIPEPAPFTLIALGFALLGFARRRRLYQNP